MFHILGSGSIGTFIAHRLCGSKIKSKLILTPRTFEKLGSKPDQLNKTWTLKSLLTNNTIQSRIPAELTRQSGDKFDYLVLTTKANTSLGALMGVWGRIDSNTTLIMLQNGMGTINEIVEELIAKRSPIPKILIGTTTHGCFRDSDPFTTTHAAQGEIWLGPATSIFHPKLPASNHLDSQLNTRLWTLLKGADLNINSPQSEGEIFRRLMDKLMINCTVNPICGLINGKNGSILTDSLAKAITSTLCEEFVILLGCWRPLNNESTPQRWKDTALLERWLYSVINQIKLNTCSMVQDLRASRTTEINYMNGYILTKSKELKLSLPMNRFLRNEISKLSLKGYN
ncbi:2-dehydropantoate 2-reductase [Conidiobolus coronatus NRRL 28638]|uniref:2-dehydropantoate 2-reductase n=1 Tax=Conidiobolus coronatus (strain ATCC 28846 / CBS 209.66 / NRRL 28638) TaxID=796925 RepID=A0A137PE71_CONC2|nr:2-dehydropantoate 2-reductase [Conidiobolus coronatus NRRL 28638]|eukprot:KXN73265.1 2-dehydropantoate 2-reductase [Conidiobolus coronatus NRRL 28638]